MRGVASKPAAWSILLVYIWIFFLFPVRVGAQADDAGTACDDAKAMASRNHSGITWFGIGCCLGGTGLLIALVMESHAPTAAMLGKSPEYVAVFSDCYKKKARDIRVNNAMGGCLALAAVYGALCMYLFVLADNQDEWAGN
jgi:hypothetical protein